MGTNYYLQSKPCPTCGHSETKKHIGKSSAGWSFHFRGYRDEGIVSCDDWDAYLRGNNKIIVNEYEEEVSIGEFMQLVHDKKCEMNSYNINSNFPMNEKEKAYLKNRNNNFPQDIEWLKHSWKDNDGHAFTDLEFC